MPSVTIKIVNSRTPVKESNPSTFGHMWYSLSDGSGDPVSYGFAPIKEGDPNGPGGVNPHGPDDKKYEIDTNDGDRRIVIQLTQDQFNKMKDFGDHPEKYGFDMNYNGVLNSCIDFTWKALEVVGLNPNHFQGDILPKDNIDEVENLQKGIVPTVVLPEVIVYGVKDSGQTFMGWVSDIANSLGTSIANTFSLAKDFFSNLLSIDTKDSQSQVNPNLIDNSLLDLDIRTDKLKETVAKYKLKINHKITAK